MHNYYILIVIVCWIYDGRQGSHKDISSDIDILLLPGLCGGVLIAYPITLLLQIFNRQCQNKTHITNADNKIKNLC